jgi:hypothetical protein
MRYGHEQIETFLGVLQQHDDRNRGMSGIHDFGDHNSELLLWSAIGCN